MELRAPKVRGNNYCGPAVISSITGLDTGEAAAVIRTINDKRAVTGTSYSDCRQALRQLGYSTTTLYEAERGKGISLAAWLRQAKLLRTKGRIFLICAGHHWQLVSGRRYTCGRIREVVSIRHEKVKRRARVARVYEVYR